jgi:hypothetical protein
MKRDKKSTKSYRKVGENAMKSYCERGERRAPPVRGAHNPAFPRQTGKALEKKTGTGV